MKVLMYREIFKSFHPWGIKSEYYEMHALFRDINLGLKMTRGLLESKSTQYFLKIYAFFQPESRLCAGKELSRSHTSARDI